MNYDLAKMILSELEQFEVKFEKISLCGDNFVSKFKNKRDSATVQQLISNILAVRGIPFRYTDNQLHQSWLISHNSGTMLAVVSNDYIHFKWSNISS